MTATCTRGSTTSKTRAARRTGSTCAGATARSPGTRARAEDLVGATFLEKWAGCGVFEGTVAGVEDADAPRPKVAVDWDDGMRTSMPLAKLRKILRREALKPTRRA